MVSWSEMARILAKESAYRSARQRQTIRTPSFWRGSGSIVQANLIPGILCTAVSCFLGLAAIFASSGSSSALPLIFGAMGAVELIFSLFAIAPSTSIMTSQRLLDPLSYRPVEESTLRKAVLAASLVYWGVGSSALVVIPASIILSVGLRTPYPIVAGTAMALTLLILAYGVGLFVASLAPSVRSDPRLRILATLAWVFILLIGYLPSMLNSLLGGAVQGAIPDLGSIVEFIPPFSFGALAAGNISLAAVASCAITLATSVIILRYSSNRLWSSLIQGPATLGGAGRLKLERKSRWTVHSYRTIFGLSIKDMKLLIRNPQRLAIFIAYPVIFLMPFLVAFFQLQGKPLDLVSLPQGGVILQVVTTVVPALGTLLGVLSEHLFYIEGEGARDLYRLPVTRRNLALSKALSAFLGLLPMGLIACAVVSYVAGILQGLTSFALLEVNIVASLAISSFSTVSSLPKEASAWSERSIGTGRMAIRLGLIIGSIILAGFFAFLAIATPVGGMGMVGLSAVLVTIAAVMYQRLRDAPLTD